ncbi:MAG: polyprenyl synthetase family protein [Planctomycetota bacterium]|nr:polyprenyl synthetase family protein [Planctomycetota bacterium]
MFYQSNLDVIDDGLMSDPDLCELVTKDLWSSAISDPIEEFLSCPGKGIRADLIDVAYAAGGGTGKTPSQFVMFVELLHAGSLIIDDIQDNSLHRRDQEALHIKFGIPLAINTGNWMYFAAFRLLAELNVDPKVAVRVFRHSLNVVKRCHEGQALDLTARFDSIHPADFWSTAKAISQLKTGSLTGLATWLGGIAANADDASCHELSTFGMNLGIALQMQNDLIELKKAARGTSLSDDLENKRVTWPWGWLANHYSTKQVNEIVNLAVNQRLDVQHVAVELFDRIEDLAVGEIIQTVDASVSRLPQLETADAIRLEKILTNLELQYV